MARKLYYKIGEACKMLGIQPYVLRYWETEFPPLNPTKSKSGQRVYSDQDLAVIRRIKELLYDEGYTIAGAKKKIDGEGVGTRDEAQEPAPAPESKSRPKRPKAEGKPTERVGEPDPLTAAEQKVDAAALAGPADQKALRAALDEARDLLAFLDARA